MTQTAKRYLLPSEIDGVLRSGEPVFLSKGHGEFKFEWHRDTGLARYILLDGSWRLTEPINHAERMAAELRSLNCHAIVRVCECGNVCDLSGKCSVCDDPFA
jgi:hypothetical protein